MKTTKPKLPDHLRAKHFESLRCTLGEHWRSLVPDPLAIPVIVVLSGALNPVHRSHVALLDVARQALEQPGRANTYRGGSTVPVGPETRFQFLAGLLAPSSESYVNGKLQHEALPLYVRVGMSYGAVRDEVAGGQPPWLGVAPWGDANGLSVCMRVMDQLQHDHHKSPEGSLLALFPAVRVLAVYGSDFLIRCPGCAAKPTLIISRQDDEATAEQAASVIEERRAMGRVHTEFTLVDLRRSLGKDEGTIAPVPELSSSKIRQLRRSLAELDASAASASAALRAELDDYLHPSVAQMLDDPSLAIHLLPHLA